MVADSESPLLWKEGQQVKKKNQGADQKGRCSPAFFGEMNLDGKWLDILFLFFISEYFRHEFHAEPEALDIHFLNLCGREGIL